MTTITINIPADKEVWFLDGLALSYHYDDTIENPLHDNGIADNPITNPKRIDNPESKASFIKNYIINKLKHDATQGHINIHWISEKANANNVNLT